MNSDTSIHIFFTSCCSYWSLLCSAVIWYSLFKQRWMNAEYTNRFHMPDRRSSSYVVDLLLHGEDFVWGFGYQRACFGVLGVESSSCSQVLQTIVHSPCVTPHTMLPPLIIHTQNNNQSRPKTFSKRAMFEYVKFNRKQCLCSLLFCVFSVVGEWNTK